MLKGVGGVEGGVEARRRACEGVSGVSLYLCYLYVLCILHSVYRS